jgi:exodeoxyribonuclease V beta subunit
MSQTTYDPQAELPDGITWLSASAGTGKTYSIVATATAAIASGRVKPEELLIITFSRLATAELRDRVHEQLAEMQLSVAPGLPQVATIHSFCTQLAKQVGLIDADHDRFLEFPDTLRSQVFQDVYLSQFAGLDGNPPDSAIPSVGQSEQLADLVFENPTAEINAQDAAAKTVKLSRFADQLAEVWTNRKQQLGVYTHDDQITILARALGDDSVAATVRRATAGFRLVLIDEFQDTDFDQWTVLRTLFPDQPGRSMVLVGDPKQSIYRFRGADLNAYLQARNSATQQFQLNTNHRADPAMVHGVSTLFQQGQFGTPQNPVGLEPVKPNSSAERLRIPDSVAGGIHLHRLEFPDGATPTEIGRLVDADLAQTVAGLLAGPTRLEGKALQPKDIAVLVRQHRRGRQIRDALAALGVPATGVASANLLDSEAADAWWVLLEQLAEPRLRGLPQLAATALIGRNDVELSNETANLELLGTLRTAATGFDNLGPSGVLELLADQSELPARLSGTLDGQQQLSDLYQLGSVFDHEFHRGVRTPAGLLRWLGQERAAGHEYHRESITTENAVRVLTVHAAKGLEFPVVAAPQLFEQPNPSDAAKLAKPKWFTPAYLTATAKRRVINIAARVSPAALAEVTAAEHAEETRVGYVTATRAACALLTWDLPTVLSADSPVHNLLTQLPGYPQLELDGIQVTQPQPPAQPAVFHPTETPETKLFVREFPDDHIDTTWRRTSFTGLTAADHAAHYDALDDEPEVGSPEPGHAQSADDLVSPMSGFPAGTRFGTVVHAIFEAIDPPTTTADQLAQSCAQMLDRHPIPDLAPATLATAIGTVMDTPLDDLTDNRGLRFFGHGTRLAELDFELPLGNADSFDTVQQLADLFGDRTLLPADDPLAGYGEILTTSQAAASALHGFLTGSIDAVLRVPQTETTPERFVIVDYKTNNIPTPPDTDLMATRYSGTAMTMLMTEAHYPLQALLYSVALHRYLKQRLPGYDPQIHLGGVGYLFVRGMAGPQTPIVEGQRCGIFRWKPPARFIQAASDVLAGVL